jgi:hypothetical protein|tara:strand:- start:567 stop:857 length:291 start_codon:yes stop_codon:yes gene_type:complete
MVENLICQSIVHIVEQNLNMNSKYNKGTRVLVEWEDIVADLHTEEDIMPCQAQTVGWIESFTDKYIRLVTTKYLDGCVLADKIVIPMGCVNNVKEI